MVCQARMKMWQAIMIAVDALGEGDFTGFNSFFFSFIPLFSIYPYTGKTKDVEMVVIDVKVSVKITMSNDYIQL